MERYSKASRAELMQLIDEIFGAGTATQHLCDYACGLIDADEECAKYYFEEKEENENKEARKQLEYGLKKAVAITRSLNNYEPKDYLPGSETGSCTIAEVNTINDGPQPIFGYEVEENEKILFDILEAATAHKALNSPEIRNFLGDYLPHGFLTSALANKLGPPKVAKDIVYDFLKSPALRLFSLQQLREWGVDTVMHTCEIVAEEHNAPGEDIEFTVRFMPSGELRKVKHRIATKREINMHLNVPEIDQNGTVWKAVWVYPGTVLDDVRQMSIKLAEQYNWDARQVIDLLLTGRLLSYPPIIMDVSEHRVRLTLPIFVPVDTVAKVFRDRQNKFQLPRRHSPSIKHSSLYNTVQYWLEGLGADKASTIGQRNQVFNAWNAIHTSEQNENTQCYIHPEWVYKELKLFMRDFKRTKDHYNRIAQSILGMNESEPDSSSPSA